MMTRRYVPWGRRSARQMAPRATVSIPTVETKPPLRQGACVCGGGCPRCTSAGKPLAEPLRSTMETRLGAGFSDVRVHDDMGAHEEARRRNAHAFTFGADIFFAAGKFSPETREGTARLAHELVHVEQQRFGRGGKSPTPGRAAEREARELGAAAASGRRVSIRTAAPAAVQCDGPESEATSQAPQLQLDPEIEALALRHFIRWWLGTTLVQDSAPTEPAEPGSAEEYSESVPPGVIGLPPGSLLPPIVYRLPLRSTLFDPLPPDPLYIEPDVGGLFSEFHARGAPVGEGDVPMVFDIYRRNQAIAGALPDLRAIAPSFLRPLIPGTWRRDIAGALTGAAVGASLNRDYMTPIEVSDRAWEAMTGAGTTMIPFPSFSF